MKLNRRKTVFASIMAGALLLSALSGCAPAQEKELAPPADITYQASEKETVTAVIR